MWEFLSSLVSLILGASSPTLPGGIPLTSQYVNQTVGGACYAPDPSTTITLTTDNFKNVTNPRRTLNPEVWGSKDPLGPTFDTDVSCNNYVLGNNFAGTSRTFLLVRQNVRISSCKTDELAGPYGNGKCGGWNNDAVKMAHRGTCTTADYTDLRKIADIPQGAGAGPLEVFWNPFSYNVNCNYEAGNNCGPGNRQNMNLKDFVYVLKKRDAFDNATNVNCPVLWDAGSSNKDACSHYFDVYMAVDTYNAMQAITTVPTDPHDPMYFLKQVVENCKENSTFMPAPDESSLEVPPIFVRSPFVKADGISGSNIAHIIPQSTSEQKAYNLFIWSKDSLFFATTTGLSTNLVKQETKTAALNVCTRILARSLALGAPTSTPALVDPTVEVPQDCYDKVGTISFVDTNNDTQVFDTYVKGAAPQTFVLTQPGSGVLNIYSITNQDYPSYNKRNSSLQLGNMQFITENQWTWATPWCKPAIYLYPEKTTAMGVKLNLTGTLTKSIPTYDEQNGWNVIAHPNGTLTTINQQPLTNNYLYYEADISGVKLPKEGWVIAAKDINKQVGSILSQIGFNTTEISDFMKYWTPRLTDKPYYFVTLLPESMINEKETISLSTINQGPSTITPDTMIRTRVAFEGLDTPIKVAPLAITSHARKGFTLTDWGGTIVGKSCEDISVK